MLFAMLALVEVQTQPATADFAPARLIEGQTLVKDDEYPYRALMTDKAGVTVFEVLVDSEGKPRACTIAVGSGSKDLDSTACSAAVLRLRFTPAHDEAGRPMDGVARLCIRWVVVGSESTQHPVPDEMILTVKALPNALSKASMDVRFMVAADGTIERCGIERSSGVAKLDQIACGAVAERFKFDPARDRAGNHYRVVRMQRIAFEVEGQATSTTR